MFIYKLIWGGVGAIGLVGIVMLLLHVFNDGLSPTVIVIVAVVAAVVGWILGLSLLAYLVKRGL